MSYNNKHETIYEYLDMSKKGFINMVLAIQYIATGDRTYNEIKDYVLQHNGYTKKSDIYSVLYRLSATNCVREIIDERKYQSRIKRYVMIGLTDEEIRTLPDLLLDSKELLDASYRALQAVRCVSIS